MIKDYFNVALKSIGNRKLRAVLTILGVIISITAIITLVLLGEGLKDTINDQFQAMGTNVVYVVPEGQGPGSVATTEILSIDDVDFLESTPYFELVTPIAVKGAQRIEYRNIVEYVMIMGIPYEDFENSFGEWNWEFIQGSMPTKQDKKGIIIGHAIWKDVFDKKIHTNTNIQLGDKKFRVIGILDSLGNQQDDNSIIMDIETFREFYDNPRQVDTISAQVKPGLDVNEVAERIEVRLARKRNDENFEVYTLTQLMEQVNTILGGITFLLSAIAFISLVVGGIGIMNSMFTNVLERTSEIGIMKAIGAKNKDILKLFLIESGLIGLIGGIIGVVIGQTLTFYIANLITRANYLPIYIEINYPVLIAMLVFAILISLLSGYLPAKRAATLKPVDAIRYD